MSTPRPLRFFDCNCAFGPYRTRVFRFARTADELVNELKFANIERGLVYHTAMRFDHPSVGNELVVSGTKHLPHLLPTWAVLPSQTGEQPPLDLFLKQMRQNNIRALRMMPDDHRYFTDEITWGDQLSAYMQHRIPLFVRGSLDKCAKLLSAFPELTLVTGSQGANPLDRYAWPLIERYPNLIFETSGYLVDGGLEEFCRRYSARRLLFGSGYPDNCNGSAMLALARAEISEDDRHAIAWDNLCRLLEVPAE